LVYRSIIRPKPRLLARHLQVSRVIISVQVADRSDSPSAPAGSRFSRVGLSDSNQERMYHSSALLLADGAVLVSGSNPNKDVTYAQWPTSYSVEKWYPLWYNNPRPQPSGFPNSLSYVRPVQYRSRSR